MRFNPDGKPNKGGRLLLEPCCIGILGGTRLGTVPRGWDRADQSMPWERKPLDVRVGPGMTVTPVEPNYNRLSEAVQAPRQSRTNVGKGPRRRAQISPRSLIGTFEAAPGVSRTRRGTR